MYKRQVLGYVKNQEDVTKVLDLVSAELTKEYDANIDINAESDITFETVSILDKEVDDIDTVLKRDVYKRQIYMNTIKKAFTQIHDVEKGAKISEEDKGEYVELKIVIPKNQGCFT